MGQFYGKSVTTSTADEDIIIGIESDLGGHIIASSVQIRSNVNVMVNINDVKDSVGDYVYSSLYNNGGVYTLTIPNGMDRISIKSLRIASSPQTLWIGIIYDKITEF